jgi:hypothetical protein
MEGSNSWGPCEARLGLRKLNREAAAAAH